MLLKAQNQTDIKKASGNFPLHITILLNGPWLEIGQEKIITPRI